MKRFFVLMAVVAVLLAAVDVLFGVVMDYVLRQIKTPFALEVDYMTGQMDDELVIFGSSRAANHYDAQQMTDSLGMNCYNFGQCGCGIYVAYAKLAIMLQHHCPRYIIYDIIPTYDYFVDDASNKLPPFVMPYYSEPGVDTLISESDPYYRVKMQSGLLRHNSTFLQHLYRYVLHQSYKYRERRGWEPLEGGPDTLKFDLSRATAYPRKDGYRYDERKIRYLRRFAARATAGSDVTFIVSPFWYGMDTAVLDTVKQICREYDIRLIDFSNDPRYVHRTELFKNGNHLTREGASQYTRDVIQRLREEGVFDESAESDDETSAKLNVSRASTVEATSPYLK